MLFVLLFFRKKSLMRITLNFTVKNKFRLAFPKNIKYMNFSKFLDVSNDIISQLHIISNKY